MISNLKINEPAASFEYCHCLHNIIYILDIRYLLSVYVQDTSYWGHVTKVKDFIKEKYFKIYYYINYPSVIS